MAISVGRIMKIIEPSWNYNKPVSMIKISNGSKGLSSFIFDSNDVKLLLYQSPALKTYFGQTINVNNLIDSIFCLTIGWCGTLALQNLFLNSKFSGQIVKGFQIQCYDQKGGRVDPYITFQESIKQFIVVFFVDTKMVVDGTFVLRVILDQKFMEQFTKSGKAVAIQKKFTMSTKAS